MDVDQCLAIAILRMKMWGVVVFKEHLDHDAKKATDLRHALAHASGAGEKILWPLPRHPQIQSVWTQIDLVIPDELSRGPDLNALKGAGITPQGKDAFPHQGGEIDYAFRSPIIKG